MKKILMTSMIVLLLAPLGFAGKIGEWEKVIGTAGKIGEWKVVRESDDIISWSRDNPASRIVEVRTIGTIDAQVPVIEAILRDTTAMKKYLFMCTDAHDIKPADLKSSPDSYYTYFRQGLPWPIWDRFGTGHIEFMLYKTPGSIMGIGRPIPLEYDPHIKHAIRMTVGDALWILQPNGDHSTEVTYQILADPAGDLPRSVVNMLMKNLGFMTIKNLRKLAKEEPYRSAKTIITTTPYHE